MRYNPEIHHRRSIRLKGYDYSQSGYYFITVCTQGRRCLFGEIEKGRMILNDAGKMIGHWWNELKNKNANIEIDEYVIMPNHCHGIIGIAGDAGGWGKGGQGERGGHAGPPVHVGADLCVCPENVLGENADSPVRGRPINEMIQWFKTMTTNEYIRNVKQNRWGPFDGKLWQRNYYEQIVRDEISLRRIREYIVNNPCQWQQDDLFV
jgi:REP element-mobilizing transposase RayT